MTGCPKGAAGVVRQMPASARSRERRWVRHSSSGIDVRTCSWAGYGPGMAAVIKFVTFDAADALALAAFWAAVFGSDVDEDSTTGNACVEAAGWGGPNIWFAQVPEGQTAKNRMHFDLRAPGPVRAEVARLEKLGATVVAHHTDHTVMADPEGNEFCIEPGPAQHQWERNTRSSRQKRMSGWHQKPGDWRDWCISRAADESACRRSAGRAASHFSSSG